jgi:hypothetical protein
VSFGSAFLPSLSAFEELGEVVLVVGRERGDGERERGEADECAHGCLLVGQATGLSKL